MCDFPVDFFVTVQQGIAQDMKMMMMMMMSCPEEALNHFTWSVPWSCRDIRGKQNGDRWNHPKFNLWISDMKLPGQLMNIQSHGGLKLQQYHVNITTHTSGSASPESGFSFSPSINLEVGFNWLIEFSNSYRSQDTSGVSHQEVFSSHFSLLLWYWWFYWRFYINKPFQAAL